MSGRASFALGLSGLVLAAVGCATPSRAAIPVDGSSMRQPTQEGPARSDAKTCTCSAAPPFSGVPEGEDPGAPRAAIPTAPATKPFFQNDYFGEMPRAFGFITGIDLSARTMAVKLDKGTIVTVPIRSDTELRFRNSWGGLQDYLVGQRLMLFMYIDDSKSWTYPKAVQDEIQMTMSHGWWAKITRIDRAVGSYATLRQEKTAQGTLKDITASYLIAPDVVVRKGNMNGGIELLGVGDEVLQQQVERRGVAVVVEVFDQAAGKLVGAAQDARHRADEDRLGLTAYVNDIEVVSGGLLVTVPWSSARRAQGLKPGDVVVLQPTDGSKPFAATISSNVTVGTRRRLQMVINARTAARASYGQTLQLFVPGTGPTLPTGRAGLPVAAR